MSWTDHDFHPNKFGRRWSNHPLWRVVAGSVPLGTWGGIGVRVHVSLFWCVGVVLVAVILDKSLSWKGAATGITSLGVLLLLHEWAHCRVSRWVGGHPGGMMLWPLGGLTSAGAPQRAGARFAVAMAGPVMNALICAAAVIALVAMRTKGWGAAWYLLRHGAYALQLHGAAFYIAWVFLVSWILLFFNVLPILPFDGGHMLHAVLWPKLGSIRAMHVVCVVGMMGAVALFAAGFMPPVRPLLILLGVVLYLHYMGQRRMLRYAGGDGFSEEPEDTAGMGAEPRRRRRRLSRRLIIRARRRAEKDRAELERVDIILAKVSAHGIRSLSWLERRVLYKATERQRRSDADILEGPPRKP